MEIFDWSFSEKVLIKAYWFETYILDFIPGKDILAYN